MDINKVRKLLDRFYDGTSTPEDIEALRLFFSETKDIPVELKPDAAIFTGDFQAKIPSAAEILGSDFIAEIDKTANAKIPSASSRKAEFSRSLPRWMAWTSIAAAACIAAVLFFHSPSNETFRIEPQGNTSGTQSTRTLTARTAAGIAGIDSIEYAVAVNTPPHEKDKTTATDSQSKIRHSKVDKTVSAAHAISDDSDGYIEINDSLQAAHYLRMVYAKIDNSLGVVNKSVRDVDRHIDESIVTIYTTLENL